MQDLVVTLIQFDIQWHNPAANRKIISDKINTLKVVSNLIILPEMFTTGFSLDVESQAEQAEGETLVWMKSLAKSTGAVITGSIIIKEEGNYYNRLLWVKPNGSFDYYNKRHLFRMAKEGNYFAGGSESPIFELRGWKIKPLICYDLRFPVWSRNTNLAYDVLLYVANWPEARINAWKTLLQARALENLSYSIGVNRVGLDGKNKAYNGQSSVCDFKGETMNQLSNKEDIISIKLSKSKLADYRKFFPANLDADTFKIHNLM